MIKQFPNWLRSRWIGWFLGVVLLVGLGWGSGFTRYLSHWPEHFTNNGWLGLVRLSWAHLTQPLHGVGIWLMTMLRSGLDQIQTWGWWGVLGFWGLYVVATVLVLPCTFLTLGAGVIYGPIWGVVDVFIGALLGSVAAFLIGRYLARGWIQQQLAKTAIAQNAIFQALQQAVASDGLKIVLLTRLSPLFPFSLLSYAYALTDVQFKDYVLGFVGCLPGTIVYVYLASLAGDLASLGIASNLPLSVRLSQWAVRGLGVVATIAVTFYISRVAQRELVAQAAREAAAAPVVDQ